MATGRHYSLPEAAAELGIHPNTLRRWIDKGQVQAVIMPSGWRRFTVEQLDQIKRDMNILPKLTAA